MVKYRGKVLVPYSKRREKEAEEAIRQSDAWEEDMPMELIDDVKVCFQLRQSGLRLKEMPKVVREHRPFVEVALQQNGMAIAYAGKELQANRELLEVALHKSGEALELLEAFQNDEEVVLWAVQTSGTCLRFACDELRKDPDLCLEAVRQNWQAIEYCDPILYSDWDFMKQAIRSSWRCLSFAHPDLCNDKEVVRIALRPLGMAW